MATNGRPRSNELKGLRQGKLTVLGYHGSSATKNGRVLKGTFWDVKCDCGTIDQMRTQNFVAKKAMSCFKCKSNGAPPSPNSKINALYAQYRTTAMQKNLCFNLEPDYFKSLILSKCAYCGRPPSNKVYYVRNGTKSEKPLLARHGIDRVDNLKGYVASNVKPCCIQCNKAKGQMTCEEFCAYLDALCAYRSTISGENTCDWII